MTTELEIGVESGAANEMIAWRLDEPAEPATRAILYLHGLGSSQSGDKATFFRGVVLQQGMAFCSFDFRGHGNSAGSLRDFTLSRALADAGAARRELAGHDYRRVAILGSSIGALTGIWYSALQPRDCALGLYIAPAMGLAETMAERLGEDGMRSWRREGTLSFDNEMGPIELGWGFVGDLEKYGGERLRSLFETPSLVLQGKLDQSVPWRAVAEFAEGCAHAGTELRLFEDGDHRLADRLPAVWTQMRAFLARRGFDEE